MRGAEAQMTDQVGLGEHHGYPAAVKDKKGLGHWAPSLAHIDEEGVTGALQEREVEGHDENR